MVLYMIKSVLSFPNDAYFHLKEAYDTQKVLMSETQHTLSEMTAEHAEFIKILKANGIQIPENLLENENK